MDPVTGSIVGKVGAALVSGLLGRGGDSARDQRKQSFKLTREVTQNQALWAREAAEKAGFNPLTVLRATGGATPMSVSGGTPELSSRQIIAEALGAGVDTWFNRDQIARDQEAEALQMATMRADLEYAQLRNSVLKKDPSFGFSIPQAVDTGKSVFAPQMNSGRPVVTQPSGVGLPVNDDPVLVRRNDGLKGANPDAPTEMETDLWSVAREGSLPSFGWEIYTRNTMTDWQRQNVEKAKDFIGDAADGVADWVSGWWDTKPPALSGGHPNPKRPAAR